MEQVISIVIIKRDMYKKFSQRSSVVCTDSESVQVKTKFSFSKYVVEFILFISIFVKINRLPNVDHAKYAIMEISGSYLHLK